MLKREIGPWGASGFALGAMLGTGVFVTTGVAAGHAGPAVLVSLLVAAVAAVCNGLSSAELAAVHPVSGGTYAYAGIRLSPGLGFAAGWLFLAAKTASAAATALAFGAYAGDVLRLPPWAVALALLLAVTLLNTAGLKLAGALNLVLVALTVGALLLFCADVLPRVSAERFSPFAPKGVAGVWAGAALLFVAYAGYGRVATLGEEIQEPRRTIPRAVVIALAASAALYLAVTAGAVGVLGAEGFAAAAAGGAPLEAAAGSRAARAALSLGAATALGSVFLNLALGLSRMGFAMARGRDLPGVLARVNGAGSPFAAVWATALAVGGMIALRSIERLIFLSAFSILVYYGLTNLAALRLSREERLVPPALPVLGLLLCAALAAAVPPRELLIGTATLAVGLLARAIGKFLRPE